jgi:hypothetical protein
MRRTDRANAYPDSSIYYYRDVGKDVTNTATRLDVNHPLPTDLTERENENRPTEPGRASNPVHFISPQINRGDPNSGSSDDELCYSPLWYRFKGHLLRLPIIQCFKR